MSYSSQLITISSALLSISQSLHLYLMLIFLFHGVGEGIGWTCSQAQLIKPESSLIFFFFSMPCLLIFHILEWIEGGHFQKGIQRWSEFMLHLVERRGETAYNGCEKEEWQKTVLNFKLFSTGVCEQTLSFFPQNPSLNFTLLRVLLQHIQISNTCLLIYHKQYHCTWSHSSLSAPFCCKHWLWKKKKKKQHEQNVKDANDTHFQLIQAAC